ncbi:DUF6763 family protein [Desulfurivibrio alkaliphilus]|uniref:Uncharacterized protein n=1 Tax=Desulfurivibrio alkaliphilus (strain DSM 19089 / UNIQEM U267 / AHT2) TaxID=589865 RepID=D6YZX5_DESAT|nr:DUF6763 family protein [Desulfurivibrio alkaliphilus]ADH85132.1 hypothetical protein DaAHT2_0426 [Desulfurivibrio alkaliphilus AHT 2]
MSSDAEEPIEGNWYELPSGEIFTVVTVDEEEGMVEVQYDDDRVEELELETWEDLGADPIDPPEQWTGGYGTFDDEDDLDVEPSEIEEE